MALLIPSSSGSGALAANDCMMWLATATRSFWGSCASLRPTASPMCRASTWGVDSLLTSASMAFHPAASRPTI